MTDVFTIIKFDEFGKTVDREVERRQRPDDPLEFLCLVVRNNGANGEWPALGSAKDWVKEYRRREVNAAHDASRSGDFVAPPIGILLLTDPAPREVETWRADCQMREDLARLGAMIIERPDCSCEQLDDCELINQTVETIVATAIVGPQTAPTAGPRGTNFEWAITPPTSTGAKAFARQPSAVEPHPDESPDPAAGFARQLETYSKADPHDLDY